jgi:hypothetical protein
MILFVKTKARIEPSISWSPIVYSRGEYSHATKDPDLVPQDAGSNTSDF